MMEIGRPEYYVLSPVTISHDVKMFFANTRKRNAKMLQEHDGTFNFTIDPWTYAMKCEAAAPPYARC